MPVRERDDQIAFVRNHSAGNGDEAAIWLSGKRTEHSLDLSGLAHAMNEHIYPRRSSRRVNQGQKSGCCRCYRIVDDGGACDRWRDLLEQLKPFCADGKLEIGKTGHVAPRMRQTGDKACADRVNELREYHRNRA